MATAGTGVTAVQHEGQQGLREGSRVELWRLSSDSQAAMSSNVADGWCLRTKPAGICVSNQPTLSASLAAGTVARRRFGKS